MSRDTIFATATAKGRAGIAVIRLSGAQARPVAARLLGRSLPARGMVLGALRGADGALIDRPLVLCFEKGASFTGEDVIELQCHGSPAVIAAAEALLAAQPELRLAEAGEFTRRALANGQLDLAQVEGLADLIEAETEAQRKQAMAVFDGAFSDKVTGWRADLVRAAALIEAVIDFADEDIPTDVSPEVRALLSGVISALEAEITGTRIAERIREGFEIAIIGPPNIGKSTLLNALAGREAAITSEVAGTTRDVIEVRMDLDGLAVTLLDTAGIREAAESIEAIGIDRARERANAADLRLFLTEAGQVSGLGVTPQEGDIIAIGQGDRQKDQSGLLLSGKTGQGIDIIMKKASETLSERISAAQTATHARHRFAMQAARVDLEAAVARLGDGPEVYELVAADIRSGLSALNSLIGAVDVEDLLDEIFASFCLGK